MQWTRGLLIAGCLLSLPPSAMAAREELQVRHAWARPALAGHSDVVSLSITDHGVRDRLVSVHSAAARGAELQSSFVRHGVVHVRRVRSVPIPVRRTVTLEPGGTHILLVGLKRTLSMGDSVPVTLTFARAGTRVAVAMVEGRGTTRERPGPAGETRTRR